MITYTLTRTAGTASHGDDTLLLSFRRDFLRTMLSAVVFYVMKLAMVLSDVNLRPAHLPVGGARATAYAADFDGEGTRPVAIHKGADQLLSIVLPSRGSTTVWRLEAPSFTARSGVTLAGATLGTKTWKPQQTKRISSSHAGLLLTLSPAFIAAMFCKETLV